MIKINAAAVAVVLSLAIGGTAIAAPCPPPQSSPADPAGNGRGKAAGDAPDGDARPKTTAANPAGNERVGTASAQMTGSGQVDTLTEDCKK